MTEVVSLLDFIFVLALLVLTLSLYVFFS